jgi:hypothetical protein
MLNRENNRPTPFPEPKASKTTGHNSPRLTDTPPWLHSIVLGDHSSHQQPVASITNESLYFFESKHAVDVSCNPQPDDTNMRIPVAAAASLCGAVLRGALPTHHRMSPGTCFTRGYYPVVVIVVVVSSSCHVKCAAADPSDLEQKL